MFSPQQEIMIQAMGLKIAAQAYKPSKNPKFTYASDGFAVHRAGTDRSKIVGLKRATLNDHSRYTGERLREIRAQNGVGKGLRRLAEKHARQFTDAPLWRRPIEFAPIDMAAE